MSKRTVACLILSSAIVALIGASAQAQSSSSTYLLRQQLGSDSYLWESMLTRDRPVRKAPLVNPAARSKAQAAVTPAYAAPAPPLTSAAQSVLNYYGNRRAAAELQQIPQTRFIPTGGRRSNANPTSRPFANADASPTVSPYLNLFREDFDESAPNYHAFVRPQLRQQRANRQQQAEINRLQRQLRAGESTPTATAGYGALPGAGRTAERFGDTGQFYGGRR